MKTWYFKISKFSYSNFIHTTMKVVTKHPKITSIWFEILNLTSWHGINSCREIVIVNFRKQCTSRFYRMKICLKAQTNLHNYYLKDWNKNTTMCRHGDWKYYILHRIVCCTIHSIFPIWTVFSTYIFNWGSSLEGWLFRQGLNFIRK